MAMQNSSNFDLRFAPLLLFILVALSGFCLNSVLGQSSGVQSSTVLADPPGSMPAFYNPAPYMDPPSSIPINYNPPPYMDPPGSMPVIYNPAPYMDPPSSIPNTYNPAPYMDSPSSIPMNYNPAPYMEPPSSIPSLYEPSPTFDVSSSVPAFYTPTPSFDPPGSLPSSYTPTPISFTPGPTFNPPSSIPPTFNPTASFNPPSTISPNFYPNPTYSPPASVPSQAIQTPYFAYPTPSGTSSSSYSSIPSSVMANPSTLPPATQASSGGPDTPSSGNTPLGALPTFSPSNPGSNPPSTSAPTTCAQLAVITSGGTLSCNLSQGRVASTFGAIRLRSSATIGGDLSVSNSSNFSIAPRATLLVTKNLDISGPSTLILEPTSQIIIGGNLTLTIDGTLELSTSTANAPVTISGCLNASGTLRVNVTDSSKTNQDVIAYGDCVEGNFSNLEIVDNDGNDCRKVNGGDLAYKTSQIAVAFRISDECAGGSPIPGVSMGGFIAMIVILGLVVVAIIVAVVLLVSKRIRHKVFPYRFRERFVSQASLRSRRPSSST